MSKTQISHLRSGITRQITNQTRSTGSLASEVYDVWKKVGEENPDSLKILIKGLELELKANWSLSRKTLCYLTNITKEQLELFKVVPSNETPFISIQRNLIKISNGKNAYTYICPSFVEIL